jgi:hypothetical protein
MTYSLTDNQLLKGRSNLSRRDFIKGAGAALGAATLLALGGQLLTTPPSAELPGTALLRSTFLRHLGDLFAVSQGSQPAAALRLTAVRDLGAPAHKRATAADQAERSFSLLFSAPSQPMLAQGTYRFEHREIGAFWLFIVPMAPAAPARYEAIFNRLSVQ